MTSQYPEPRALNIVCSICGQPWDLHTKTNGDVPLTECVRLLKSELARRPRHFSGMTYTTPGLTIPVSDGTPRPHQYFSETKS